MNRLGGKLRKLRVLAVALVIGLLGAGAAFAISKHTGSSTLDCNGAHLDYVSFANANNNTVSEQLLVNGSVLVTKTFVLQNSPAGSGHDDIPFPTPLNGNYTVQVKATWNTNGHSGSFDSGLKSLGCFTTTTTVVTTRTVTTPPVTTTVTTPTQTVTNPTVTVQLPAPPAPPTQTVTNTVTLPAITVTTPTKTVAVKSPPKIVTHTIYKTKKAPICKPKRSVPKPPILLPTK